MNEEKDRTVICAQLSPEEMIYYVIIAIELVYCFSQ